MHNMPFDDFVQILASKQPTPGGGSATAMCGALGMALSNMVGNLTLGKNKYAAHEDEIKQLLRQGETITAELLTLIDKDAAVFKPLAHAYGLSKDNPKQIEFRKQAIENAAIDACSVPLVIMQKAYDGLLIHQRMSKIGTVIALSDIGCGTAFLKATLTAARFNVLINLKSITNESFIQQKRQIVDELLKQGNKIADAILTQLNQKLIK
jgi:formiminotetrahydrofolate cyclodeaminase